MNTHWSTAVLCALAFFSGAACGDTVKVNETEKGGLGESCRARNDCQGDLVCRDNVCTNEGAGGEGSDAGALAAQVRGGEGESCQRRADCEAELACIDNVCVPEPEGDAGLGEPAATRGKRGESCAATSDCEAGLVCIGQRCREADIPVSYSSKQCSIVECANDADCCQDKPSGGRTQDDCSQARTDCLADPVNNLADCNEYQVYCACESLCENELCTDLAFDACLIDDHCGGQSCIDERCEECAVDLDCQFFFGRPYCVTNECVGCRAEADCADDESCVDGFCYAGCSRDEQCPLMQECVDAECVEVGCQSDRECFFYLGDERAACLEGDCVVPCETDAECPTGEFMVCEDSVCRPVGCETDAECRAYLNVANRPTRDLDRAVCREPME